MVAGGGRHLNISRFSLRSAGGPFPRQSPKLRWSLVEGSPPIIAAQEDRCRTATKSVASVTPRGGTVCRARAMCEGGQPWRTICRTMATRFFRSLRGQTQGRRKRSRKRGKLGTWGDRFGRASRRVSAGRWGNPYPALPRPARGAIRTPAADRPLPAYSGPRANTGSRISQTSMI